jgi:hypothetical protein
LGVFVAVFDENVMVPLYLKTNMIKISMGFIVVKEKR